MRNHLPFDFETIMNRLFMNILFNWDSIKCKSNIMSSVDMDTNNLCIYFKEQNPMIRDSFIQAYVLSFYIVMLHIIGSNQLLLDH